MSAAGFTPIQLYRSTTASAVPTSGNLADGELAINTNDGKLYYKDSGGTVQLIASKAGASGDVVGPASATDNAVVRFDGTTGKLVQNSVVTIADSTGDIAGAGSITSTSASGILTRAAATQDGVELIGRAGGSSSYKVTLTPTTLGGNRTLTLPDTTGTVALTGSTVASFSAGSTGFTPNTATTGAVTLAGTLATTNGGTGLTSFTANGVVYASSSSALATGSALTFDGMSLGLNVVGGGALNNVTGNLFIQTPVFSGAGFIFRDTSAGSFAEYMRLTSTGLGIGTSSPSEKLEVVGVAKVRTGGGSGIQIVSAATPYIQAFGASGNNVLQLNGQSISFWSGASYGAESEKMRLDSSGNLGLGVTPSAWSGMTPAVEIGGYGSAVASWGSNRNLYLLSNAYYGSGGFTYKTTGGAAYYNVSGETNSHKWYTAPSGTAGNAITFTQAMTLDASGNLVVGTTNTAQGRVHAHATTNAQFVATDATLGSNYGGVFRGYGVGGSGGFAELGVLDNTTYTKGIVIEQNAVNVRFFTGSVAGSSSERARIDSSGNLLVGTTSSTASPAVGCQLVGGGNGQISVGHDTGALSGYYYASFAYNSGVIGSITQNGTTGVLYNITSDYRLKNVIGSVTGSGERIDALEPVDYTWKADGSTARGFLAHKFQEVYPNSVTGSKDEIDTEGNPVYQAMQASSSEVIADLVAEIQSLRQRVALLEGN